jgi:hypothetical protein
MSIHLRGLWGDTHARSTGAIENNELAFEEDVTIKVYADRSAGLDATKAFRAGRGVVDIFAGDDGTIIADTKGEVRKSG